MCAPTPKKPRHRARATEGNPRASRAFAPKRGSEAVTATSAAEGTSVGCGTSHQTKVAGAFCLVPTRQTSPGHICLCHSPSVTRLPNAVEDIGALVHTFGLNCGFRGLVDHEAIGKLAPLVAQPRKDRQRLQRGPCRDGPPRARSHRGRGGAGHGSPSHRGRQRPQEQPHAHQRLTRGFRPRTRCAMRSRALGAAGRTGAVIVE